MPKLPQRTIEEILALHDLNPSLQEVYVEGHGDKNFIEWVLAESGLGHVAVFEIQTVNIDKQEVLLQGLDDSNRGRVVTLAVLLNEKIKYLGQLICIADRDFDDLFGIARHLRLLILTDYTSIEMYAYNERTMNKLLKIVVNGFPKTGAELLHAVQEVLKFQFLVRAANQKLGLGCKILGIQGHCEFGNIVAVKEEAYVRNVLNAGAQASHHEAVLDSISEYRRRVVHEPRLRIHGHDFATLIVAYIRSHSGCGSIHPNVITRGMLASVELAQLLTEPMFVELIARLWWKRG